jgi:hypothetical protein
VTCEAPDCDEPHYAHGWCTAHYARVRRNGDPAVDVPVRVGNNGRTNPPPAMHRTRVSPWRYC